MTDLDVCDPLLVEPAYPLRDRHGRAQLLEDLTRWLVGLNAPLQVRHGHRPNLTLLRGGGAARVLTGNWRAPRRPSTVVLRHDGGEVPVSVLRLPTPVGAPCACVDDIAGGGGGAGRPAS